MTITVKNLAKKYNRSVIFKGLDYEFQKGIITAITGSNGSGKSTLLRVLSSQLEPDAGNLVYEVADNDHSMVYEHIGFVAPYIDIPDEFSFLELLKFHSKFKQPTLSLDQIITTCFLEHFAKKPIKEYSSGMKQRVKLSLNLFFLNEIYLFDEPCSHLDSNGFNWFNKHLPNLKKHGTVIIASNNKEEIKHASQSIDIQQFK
ncbi:MAG: ABC transporter ATP-binding protein [Bacteroidia bacterium]